MTPARRPPHRGVEGVTWRLLGALAAALMLVACGDAEDAPPIAIPGAATAVDDPFSGGYPTFDDEASGLRLVFGTPDIATGAPRISFAIFDRDGLISFPVLNVSSAYLPDGPAGEVEEGVTQPLRFHRFPDGGRGIYVGYMEFPQPGLWTLDVAVPRPDGTVAHVLFPVDVLDDTVAPNIGATAPASHNRTVHDEPELARLTTASVPDAALYQTSVADALAEGRPFVLTFASPAFCTNALCGPQVEVLTELREAHEAGAAFIHVDLYENPTEIRGDLSVARRTPVLEEWGVHTDEWTFVVDADGIVRARFEGFAPREEVETALLSVLHGTAR